MTVKRRVYYKTDNTVAIVTPIPESKKLNETEQEWLIRVYEKTPIHKEGLPFDDIGVVDLPSDKTKRHRWRGSQGQGVFVDNDVVIPEEVLQAKKTADIAALGTRAEMRAETAVANSIPDLKVRIAILEEIIYSNEKGTID